MLRPVLSRLSPAGPRARLSTLIFHRVLPEADPLFPGEVDAVRFDALCRWVAAWFNVLPLDEAVQRLSERRLPERALAITFDDGYADNREVALPILQRHHLTATFFIATGFIDGGRMWNDSVIEAVRHCQATSIDLSALGVEGLAVLPLPDHAARRAAIDAILDRIKYRPIAERLQLAQRIAELAQVRPSDTLMMTADQVRELHRAGMQIGAHTVSHPILATLSDDEACTEIGTSKRWLEDLLQQRVGLFAYPNGRPGRDFNERSVTLAREAGFDAAVTTAKGVADADTDLYRVPRFTPWDGTRLRFGLRMAHNLWAQPEPAAAA